MGVVLVVNTEGGMSMDARDGATYDTCTPKWSSSPQENNNHCHKQQQQKTITTTLPLKHNIQREIPGPSTTESPGIK